MATSTTTTTAATPPLLSLLPAPFPDSRIALRGTYVTLEGLGEHHIASLWQHLQGTTGSSSDSGPNPLFKYLPWQPASSAAELWTVLQDTQQHRGFVIYAICADPAHVNPLPQASSSSAPSPAHTDVLGIIGYLNITPAHRDIEIGAVVFSSALQRSAAATEAAYLLLHNAFTYPLTATTAPYRRVVWKCNTLNAASHRAALRLGFTYEGTWRNHMLVNGASRDSAFFSVLDREWARVRDALRAWLDERNFDGEGRQRRALEEIRQGITEAAP